MASFRTVTDKDYDSVRLNSELQRLRKNGLVLPRHSGRAAQSYGEAVTQTRAIQKAAGVDLDNLSYSVGKTITSENLQSPEVQSMLKENQAKTNAMGQKRALSYRMQRTAASVTPGGTDAQNAIPRFYDPLEYWDLSGLPWNVADEGHRHKLHKWLRLYYATHYLVPTLIDIFTRFPLIGIELECKDHALTDIYEEIFLRNLKYDEFFVGLGREYWCALPGELIQGPDGPVSIELVQAGDLVLTHKGVLKPVKGASSREYSGKYVTLRPHYGLPMRYTYGHPFLVRRDEKTEWVSVEEIRASDELFVPVDQRVQDLTEVNVFETLQGWLQVPSAEELAKWSIPDHITWTDSETKYRSWVARQIRNLTPGSVWKRLDRAAQHSPLPGKIELTEDNLWFFGLYLAEGAVTKDGVRISLHAKEIAYAERVVSVAAGLGLNATIRYSGENGINVVVYSIAFGAWIESLLGTGHSGKRIPEWMMILPIDKQAYILRGYFDGDGHYGDVRVHAASASLSLALQVERMIRRQGIVTTINEANSTTENGYDCQWWMVGPSIGDTRVFLERLGVPGKREFKKRQFGCWQGANEGYWVKVFQIDNTGEYTGPVYNIEVEDDHSYVGSVATHNCVGEAFPLGSFDEDLGVWEHEELINPEDVVIDNFPFLNTQQLKIVPPDYLRRIAQTKSPAREWYLLQEQYADLIPYLLKGEHIPISPVMIRQVANKMNNWDDHGTPILLRGLRTLLYEEKLLASQEAIAERLYSPLILAKLGIMDMGEGLPPWIPGPAELESVRDDLDLALASDFRLMVHHFGLDITSVFGREQMPRLGDDFDRIERRIMQVFGVNPSLLSAGSNSQPYASSALQAEFMNQILKTFQNMLKAHYRERALVVAEAQGHQDYTKKGQTRVPIFERVVVYDDEGNKEIKEVPKLLVPDLTFACLAYGSRVSTPEGPVATETLGVGDWVISWDVGNDCAVPAEVTHSYDNGIQDVYQITTALGRQIEATGEHPFLTNEGWIEAQNLHPGIELRVGTDVPSGLLCPLITERDARFLGMIAGDGSVSCCEEGAVPAIANVDSEILRWVNNYALGVGCSLTPHADGVIHYISQIDQRVNPNPIKRFLQDHEMSGKTSWTKRVPKAVWAAGPGAWAAFLSGYLDTDGSVVSDTRIVWDSRNRDLLLDCHELLAFLGIRATLYEIDLSKWPDPQGVGHEGSSYRLVVQSKEGLASCQRWLEPLAHRKQHMSTRVSAVDERRSLSPNQAQEIKTWVQSKTNRLAAPSYKEIGERYDVSPSTVWRAVQGDYDGLISTWISAKWDEVRSIEIIKNVPTWSLGIEGDHTHITEGLVTHNTFDLRDEATERQFLMELRQMGVPLPNADLLIGVDWKYKDKIDEYNTELKEQTIAQQEAKMDTYYALTVKGLPVPLDLKAECESVLIHGPGAGGGAPQGAAQGMGGPPPGGPGAGGPPGGPGAGPGGEAIVMPPAPPGLGSGPGTAPPGGGPPAASPMAPGPAGSVPQVSNERRPGLTYNTSNDGIARLSVAEGSELDKFLGEYPDLGLPFVDYLSATHDDLEDLDREGLNLLKDNEWPKHAATYQRRVADEVAGTLASLAEETKADAILAKPEKEFVLKKNQELQKTASGTERIVETPSKKKVKIEVEKKYSIIDVLATDLSEDDKASEQPDNAEPKFA